MIKLGIIGYPLGHTLSPVMHKAALSHLGIEGDYLAIETPAEDLVDRVKYLRIQEFRGFNVTIPLKIWITPFLNEVDDYANMVGAVNTVLITENKELHGYNTDIYGFMEAIPKETKENIKSKQAAILGAGGAARAVAVGLAMLGLDELNFYARNPEKAENIKNLVSRQFPNIQINVKEFNEYTDLSYASILVNTTPIGMEGLQEDISPINKKSIEKFAEDTFVYDLIYKPRETRLLQYARQNGLQTIDGLEMLVLQGAKALSIWINQEAPVDVMRQAALESLNHGESSSK